MSPVRALRGVVVVTCAAMSVSLLPALAGCGSTKKAATTTAASSVAAPTTATSGTPQPVKAATYNINLTHVTGASGAPSASGLVVLSVRSPSDELCWSISPVKNFTVSSSTATPTIVTIQPTPFGTPASLGIPLGPAYKSSGCVHPPSVFLGRLEANPQIFYLSIYNTQSGEAVRGQI
jgi:hypothetical protein